MEIISGEEEIKEGRNWKMKDIEWAGGGLGE